MSEKLTVRKVRTTQATFDLATRRCIAQIRCADGSVENFLFAHDALERLIRQLERIQAKIAVKH